MISLKFSWAQKQGLENGDLVLFGQNNWIGKATMQGDQIIQRMVLKRPWITSASSILAFAIY